MAEVDEISFFKIFKYITIKVLIGNVECAIKISFQIKDTQLHINYIRVKRH